MLNSPGLKGRENEKPYFSRIKIDLKRKKDDPEQLKTIKITIYS